MPDTANVPILELGNDFYDTVRPAAFPTSALRYKNEFVFQQIHLNDKSEDFYKKHFWSFEPLPENLVQPLALRYHGHQFAHYNPDLGDGRGFLFAQIFDSNQKLFDLGTKGSGTTPYSRRGDGRLTLKGAFREALATEMLESLGVNTSKTLIFYETGESLDRSDEPSPTRSAVLTRLSHSHIRFGTFQRLAHLQQPENIKKLVDYVLKYYVSQKEKSLSPPDTHPFDLLFPWICTRTADLVASIMMCGFVHGVLNTDNMNVTGELFDYGPYRFMAEYNPNFVAAYFDGQGLYRFGRQPFSFAWGLEQLAKSLMFAHPEFDPAPALQKFGEQFNDSVQKYFLRRLNLIPAGPELTADLISEFFTQMEDHQLLFEQTFFDFHSGWDEERLKKSPQYLIYQKAEFSKLKNLLQSFPHDVEKKLKFINYLSRSQPETLRIEEIEKIWSFIDDKNDWTEFNAKLDRIRSFRGLYS